ncbi:hypothetical protein JW960_27765 [candidate division KSB1 bacterium]|nr:hypothetical protein [candidate division KSB1 bacterium]
MANQNDNTIRQLVQIIQSNQTSSIERTKAIDQLVAYEAFPELTFIFSSDKLSKHERIKQFQRIKSTIPLDTLKRIIDSPDMIVKIRDSAIDTLLEPKKPSASNLVWLIVNDNRGKNSPFIPDTSRLIAFEKIRTTLKADERNNALSEILLSPPTNDKMFKMTVNELRDNEKIEICYEAIIRFAGNEAGKKRSDSLFKILIDDENENILKQIINKSQLPVKQRKKAAEVLYSWDKLQIHEWLANNDNVDPFIRKKARMEIK